MTHWLLCVPTCIAGVPDPPNIMLDDDNHLRWTPPNSNGAEISRYYLIYRYLLWSDHTYPPHLQY